VRVEEGPRTGKGLAIGGGEGSGLDEVQERADEGGIGERESIDIIGTGAGRGGDDGAQGGSGGMLKREGKGDCWVMRMREEEIFARARGEMVLERVRWEPESGIQGWVGRMRGWFQRVEMGEWEVRRSSFAARIAERWRRRRRRGSRPAIDSRAERRTLDRTPSRVTSAFFWDLLRMEEVLGEMEERQMEPHSRTGRIQEQ